MKSVVQVSGIGQDDPGQSVCPCAFFIAVIWNIAAGTSLECFKDKTIADYSTLNKRI